MHKKADLSCWFGMTGIGFMLVPRAPLDTPMRPFIPLLLAMAVMTAHAQDAASSPPPPFALVIHGGAGVIDRDKLGAADEADAPCNGVAVRALSSQHIAGVVWLARSFACASAPRSQARMAR